MGKALEPGELIAGRYTLKRCVGVGGMGEVWEADCHPHDELCETVALKFVKTGASASSKLRRRLLREAKAACAIRHPHVVRVHDILERDDEAPVMVMELLEGESLAAVLETRGEMELEDFAPVMQQVVSAVGAAHAQGIVHRDLKPENIFLLDSPDGSATAKILDFGIAKLAPSMVESSQSTDLTRTGSLVGTPCYMSPEQIYAEKDIDHRSDIWALGIIMYQALSGILPTAADNVGQVMKIITTRPIWPLSRTRPDLPAEITSLVDRMIARNRADRPASLHEVRKVLARHTDCDTPDFGEPANPGTDDEPLSEDSQRIALRVSTQADALSDTAPRLRANEPMPRSVSRLATLPLAAVGVVAAAVWLLQARAPAASAQSALSAIDVPVVPPSPETPPAIDGDTPAPTPVTQHVPTATVVASTSKVVPKARPAPMPRAETTASSAVPPPKPKPELGQGKTAQEPPF